MRFDIHVRQTVRQRLAEVSAQMALRETQLTPSPDLQSKIIDAIQPFLHTTAIHNLVVGGVDGSGDFPTIAYGDSFVYATVAAGTLYRADGVHGLSEIN